jgi:two-component system, OmpR family, response regulator CpxR
LTVKSASNRVNLCKITTWNLTILYSDPGIAANKMKNVDRILVIDDDVELCSLVSEYLRPEGFQVDCVHDGRSGLARALSGDHLMAVLDVMLPGMNGFDVLRKIRDTSRIPVVLLTARGEDVDRIVGLEIGADDYLPKPFNPRELVARIRAVLRRTHGPGEAAVPDVIRVGDVELDPATRTVLHHGKPVELTSVEFSLLQVLLREAGKVVTREALVDEVLGRKFSPFDRSIDMHVSKIRRKLEEPDSEDHIKTIRGSGYIFALARPPKKSAVR